MNTYASKAPKNQSSAHTNSVQAQNVDTPALQLTDKRPESVVQHRLKAIINKSSQVKQLAAWKTFMHRNEKLQGNLEATIQRKENNTGLPDNLKAGIENISGFSMDDVTVHYNSEKPSQLQAHAYAQGKDIHVAPGQEKHLPHEAWHVVQQMQGRVQPTMQMKDGLHINDDKGLENEADVMGDKALQAKVQSPGGIAGSISAITPEHGKVRQRQQEGENVNENKEELIFGQVSKDSFLNALFQQTVKVADAVLAKVNQSSDNCPYIRYWFALCASQSPQQVEKYITRYASDTQGIVEWQEIVAIVVDKVKRGLEVNLQSGSLEGVPEEVPKNLEITESLKEGATGDTAQLCCLCGDDAGTGDAAPSLRATALGFTLANLTYASGRGGKIGSIYFTTGRIRLAHKKGPKVAPHANILHYTISDADYGPKGSRKVHMGDLIVNVGNLSSFMHPINVNQGDVLIESFDGGTTVGHISRGGPVTAPALTQRDINLMIQLIDGGAGNDAIRNNFPHISMN